MKVEKNKIKILLYSWQTSEIYFENLAIWIFFLSKSAEFGPFFPWKMLFMGLGLSRFRPPSLP
jgi:hypothetical protein